MVSFFGLKIGGEKKKKSTKEPEVPTPQPQNNDLSAVDDDFLDMKAEAGLYSLSRQDSGLSTQSKRSRFKGLVKTPFSSSKLGSSTVDLPNPPGLRHHVSNPSFGRRWNTGSASSLSFAPPPNFTQMARPSTSDGERKIRPDPLDVHLTRDSPVTELKGSTGPSVTDGQSSTPWSVMPKSPLGQYELKLDLPSDLSSFADFGDFGAIVETPAPLRIKKQVSTRLPSKSQKETQPLQKLPTTPQSIDEGEVLETSVSEPRSPSALGHDSIPPALQELENAISELGPATSLPSPSTSPRTSEEEKLSIESTVPRSTSRSTKKGSSRPVIQDVCAKRDTLTISSQRRRSLQMRLEAAERANIPSLSLADRPKTSTSGRHYERPPPLILKTSSGLSGKIRNGPQSAPFLPNPQPLLTPKSPLRAQVGRTGQLAPVSDACEQHSEVGSPTGSSIYNDESDDGEAFSPAVSPESTSPVIPLTGPLASPRFPPSSQSPFSYFGTPGNPWKDAIDTDQRRVSIIPPIPPRSLRRNPPTSDSGYCPSPSPLVSSFDRAAMPPSPADSRLRSESGSESLYNHDPLEPPRIPTARTGAGSRPRTPVAMGEFTAPLLKRTQTAGPLSESETGGRFGGGSKDSSLPTRAKTETSRRRPVRAVGKDLGA